MINKEVNVAPAANSKVWEGSSHANDLATLATAAQKQLNQKTFKAKALTGTARASVSKEMEI